MSNEDKMYQLQEEKEQLIGYMKSKIKSEDWHAVSDAANDLREIEVELKLLNDKERSHGC